MIHFVHGIAIIITKSKGQNERWNGIDCSNDVSDGYLAMGQGTTEKIFTISRPPQVVSSALHAQKPSSLSSPPYFLQTTHIHPPLPQFLTHLCTSPTHTLYIPSPYPHPKPLIRLPIILSAVLVCAALGQGLHLPVCGRQLRLTPAFGLAGALVL